MVVPSLNDHAVDGTLNTTSQPISGEHLVLKTGWWNNERCVFTLAEADEWKLDNCDILI